MVNQTKHLFQTECKRVFLSRRFLFAFLVSMAVVLVHLFLVVQTYYSIRPFSDQYHGFLTGNAFSNSLTMYTSAERWERYYYLAIPLLCTIPFGTSLFEDINSGYINHLLVTHKKSDFLRTRYLVTFISGGMVAVLPVVLDFILTACFFPLSKPYPGYTHVVWPDGFLANVYYHMPMVYLIVIWTIMFLVAGSLSTIALSAAGYLRHSYTVLLTPFVINLVWNIIVLDFQAPDFAPSGVVQGAQAEFLLRPLAVFTVVPILLAGSVFLYWTTWRNRLILQ